MSIQKDYFIVFIYKKKVGKKKERKTEYFYFFFLGSGIGIGKEEVAVIVAALTFPNMFSFSSLSLLLKCFLPEDEELILPYDERWGKDEDNSTDSTRKDLSGGEGIFPKTEDK